MIVALPGLFSYLFLNTGETNMGVSQEKEEREQTNDFVQRSEGCCQHSNN